MEQPEAELTEPIGRVVALWRYPVKSMGGDVLSEVDVSWHGLAGDRRWAFIRGGVERSGFPWLTIRERADMGQFRPWFVEPEDPDKSPTRVLTPTGQEYDVVDPALAAELGFDARVIKQSRGVFDTFPISLITTQTVATLGKAVGTELDYRRFRPNLLVEAIGTAPFPEDDWIGDTYRIGSAAIRLDKRDQRCAVVNVDPDTSKADPSVLRTITQAHEKCLGAYGSTVRPGRISVGDLVYIESS